MPENETKEEKSTRLMNFRVNKTLSRLKQLENLSSPNYTYTEEQIEKVIETLQEAVERIEAAFSKTNKEVKEFTL